MERANRVKTILRRLGQPHHNEVRTTAMHVVDQVEIAVRGPEHVTVRRQQLFES